jgi:hypothetical protein
MLGNLPATVRELMPGRLPADAALDSIGELILLDHPDTGVLRGHQLATMVLVSVSGADIG